MFERGSKKDSNSKVIKLHLTEAKSCMVEFQVLPAALPARAERVVLDAEVIT